MQRNRANGPPTTSSRDREGIDVADMHLAAFAENIDSAGVFAFVAALADARLFTQGDDLRVPGQNKIFAVAGGADAVVQPRFRFTSPTLDELTRYEISAINSQNAAGVEPDSPAKLDDLRMGMLELSPDEILQVELNNNSAAVQDQWALVWFTDAKPEPVTGGRPFTVRATGTTTLVDIAWTSVTITLDENLPPGEYDVIGLRPESLGCVAARVIFRTGAFMRPGALGCDTVLDILPSMFRHGELGVWGSFPFTQLPAIEFLSVIADTAETVHLDLIRR